jgi:ABC-type thiamin/hydroxymethylpyrimidine transport system permease subunit
MACKHKRWIKQLKTSEIILIALFTAVQFSIVDIPWFVFGDVLRAVLGPLGPFMSIVTGIFYDILQAMFLVALIVLVPKPGVVIISAIVRIILQGIAFGTFNPITILLMLSYAFLADVLLNFSGFTGGKKIFTESWPTFCVLGIIFALQHIYSTYTFYYIWMYIYRLFYPDWYINVNAVVSVVYSVLGAVMGVYLGNKLRRVVE